MPSEGSEDRRAGFRLEVVSWSCFRVVVDGIVEPFDVYGSKSFAYLCSSACNYPPNPLCLGSTEGLACSVKKRMVPGVRYIHVQYAMYYTVCLHYIGQYAVGRAGPLMFMDTSQAPSVDMDKPGLACFMLCPFRLSLCTAHTPCSTCIKLISLLKVDVFLWAHARYP